MWLAARRLPLRAVRQAAVRAKGRKMPAFAGAVIPWREAWLHPRRAVRDALDRKSTLSILLLPVASGVVQSLVQAASSSLGARGASAEWILVMGFGVGALWGLLQVHLATALLYPFATAGGVRVSFLHVRTAVAVSSAPLATALVFWVTATLSLGPDLYVNPAAVVSTLPPGELMEVGLLYLATGTCMVWSSVILLFTLAEVQRSSLWRALGTVGASVLALALVVGVVAGLAILAF